MTYFQAYLLTRLDAFNGAFVAVCFVTGLIAGFSALAFVICHDKCIAEEKTKKTFGKITKIFIPIFVAVLFLKALIPTTKQAAFIYIAPAIVNNQDIQKTIKKIPELSGLGLEYFSEVLKQEVEEVKQEAKETIKTKK